MKTLRAGHRTAALTTLVSVVVLGVVGVAFLGAGCDSGGKGDGEPKDVEVMSLSDWIGQLRTAYLTDGIRGFEETKKLMAARERALRDSPYYDTAAIVLGLGETAATSREPDSAAALRGLARHIEEHPGRSREVYERLRSDLISYCFGNGAIDHGSIPVELIQLYSVIATTSGERLTISVEQLLGKYIATDYAWCSVSAPDRPEEWARGHVWREAAILREVFAMDGIVVLNPRYEICRYPKRFEGEVPTGVRRRLSDFYGAGTERACITTLEVYESGHAYPRWLVEVIDENTLWDTSGPWLFEWRRDGAGANPVPLKQRALGDVGPAGD